MRKMRTHTCDLRQEKPLTKGRSLVPGPHFPGENFSDMGEWYRMTLNHTFWNTATANW